jgi:uncharacterized protein (DUF885 family)
MHESERGSEVFEFADALVEHIAELEPLIATQYGIDTYDDELNDFSIAHEEEIAAFLRDSLRALESIETSGDPARVGKAFMTERLTSRLGLIESGEVRRTFSVLWSPAMEIRGVFDIQPAETSEHAERIRARLAAVRRALESWRGALDEDSARGWVPARRHSLGVSGQLAVFAGGAFRELGRRAGETCGVDAEASGLLAAGADADAASGEMSQWLREVHAPRAGEVDAAGAERYREWSRYHNGADLDLDEIYEWGWEDLKRINARMWEIAAEVAPAATSLREAAATLDADETRAVYGTDALLDRLKALTVGAVEMLDGKHFDIDERIRFCDARLAPAGSAAAAYYIPPSEDLSRSGTTWYPTLGHDHFPIWRDVSTWYHESVPGHHLQCATAIIEKERLTRFQRVGFISGYGEGWALYAERLMDELGAFEDPGDEMGHLSGQALRAARIVTDIGMHLGKVAPADIGELGRLGDVAGRVWDAEMAVALLVERAIEQEEKAISEVDRYLGLPGQAIAYKVGERVWLECREDARRRIGPAFDLKAWHAHALRLGPLGLGPFREEMAAFKG